MLTTYECIAPIIFGTYGKGAMAEGLAKTLAEKIDNPSTQPRYGARSREEVVRLTCWDWFSGGSTAPAVAKRIEETLARNA